MSYAGEHQVLNFLDGADNAPCHLRDLTYSGDRFWIVNDSSLRDYSDRANLFEGPLGLE